MPTPNSLTGDCAAQPNTSQGQERSSQCSNERSRTHFRSPETRHTWEHHPLIADEAGCPFHICKNQDELESEVSAELAKKNSRVQRYSVPEWQGG